MNLREFAELTLDYDIIGLNTTDYNITFISHPTPQVIQINLDYSIELLGSKN